MNGRGAAEGGSVIRGYRISGEGDAAVPGGRDAVRPPGSRPVNGRGAAVAEGGSVIRGYRVFGAMPPDRAGPMP